MAAGSPAEVLAILQDGRDDDLLGLEENRWFDAKGQAYILSDNTGGRWELAKDVSAMANAEGGLILVGAQTTREESWLEERVSEIVPVPENLLDVQQHLDVIREWTFPPVAHRVHPTLFRRADGKALLAIVVEAAPLDEQPILVRSMSEGGRDVQAFAIARRYGTATEWVSGAQLWADMRDGRLARRNVQAVGGGQPLTVDRVHAMVDMLEERTEAKGHAILVYSAFPAVPAGSIADFFSPEGTMGALKALPERSLRHAGFGLGYGLEVETVDGALTVIEPRRRALLVARDGLTVALAVATDDFLGWASSQQRGIPPASLSVGTPALALNRIVLAEYAFEFTRFVRDAVAANLGAPTWRFHVAARRLKTGDPRPYLPMSMNWLSHDAQVPLLDEAEDEFDSAGDAELDAFELLSRFVQWFGVGRADVPFATDGRITEESVRNFD